MTSPGRRLAAAIAERDRVGLRDLVAPDLDFMGLTPRKLWTAEDPDGLDHVVFDNWFEEQDRVTGLVSVEEDRVADTERVGYRLDLETPNGSYVVEQQAYYRTEGDRISYLRVVCSGFRER